MANKATNNTSKGAGGKSTQESLQIAEIKDGVVALKDGSLRAVVLASAINFDLMSRQEQDAVEYSYQGFLNSLHFPIQIVIKSTKVDLDNYIQTLNKHLETQDNALLAELMEDYIGNIKALIEEVNIMDKQFFVVVPYFPPVTVNKTNVFQSIANLFKPTPTINIAAGEFDKFKRELSQRVQLITTGLTQMGVRAIPLSTQELVDLYYTCYNPDVAPNQKLIAAAEFQGAAVTKGSNDQAPRPPVIPGTM